MLEAFACGRPVTASALDGIPEALGAGNYGQLVQLEAVDELASAMAHWARQWPLGPAERSDLHQRLAARFSLMASVRNLLDMYL